MKRLCAGACASSGASSFMATSHNFWEIAPLFASEIARRVWFTTASSGHSARNLATCAVTRSRAASEDTRGMGCFKITDGEGPPLRT